MQLYGAWVIVINMFSQLSSSLEYEQTNSKVWVGKMAQ